MNAALAVLHLQSAGGDGDLPRLLQGHPRARSGHQNHTLPLLVRRPFRRLDRLRRRDLALQLRLQTP
jgi:hypothetical protein